MDKQSVLDEIFGNDPFGLLNIKPMNTSARNADERLLTSFEELNTFFEKNKREPKQGGGVQEHQLYARLKSLRESPTKMEMLKSHDKFGLLIYEAKEINSLDDILADDMLGLLDDDSEGLFDLKHVKNIDERASTDFVARRKPCKDFDQFEQLLKDVQKDLASGKRKLVEFKMGNLRENTFYVHNGVLFLLKEINISKKDHYRADGTRVREDGRTRCIFENGTESNMLKRSVEKILYANGKTVSENADRVADTFKEKFSNINENDQESGYIYILKSKSEKPEIKAIQNLYKIGFSTVEVEERIKNANQEPTYLMADVRIIMTFKCFNINTYKLEQLLHTFFGKACLNIDIFDKNGNRHTPREWFIAPLNIIEQAIELIISGNIIHYRYDSENEEILKR
jgi:hypothetical protein